MIRFKGAKVSPTQEYLMLDKPTGWFGRGRSRDRPMDEATALKISAFYRAVDLRSDSIGRLPIQVKNLKTREPDDGHHLGKVLWQAPNEAMTPFVYKKLVEYQRLVLGNAYVWIVRDNNGRPIELIPLPPGTCTPYVQHDNGKLWYIATNPKTKEMHRLDPMDVLHYKGMSRNGIEGMSLLSQAALTLSVARDRDEYEREIYANGGQPSGVLSTTADLSDKKEIELPDGSMGSYQDYIRYKWEQIHTGAGKRMRVAVLDNSLEYKPIAMSLADAQLVESKSLSVADIARFTGVPLYLLFSGKESFESNTANGIEYVKYALQPVVTQYEEEDSRKLLTLSELRQGLWLPRNMMAELRGDTKTRMECYRIQREIGVLNVNEIRALEDLAPVDGGDDYYASLNGVPLADWPELSRRRAANREGGERNGAD